MTQALTPKQQEIINALQASASGYLSRKGAAKQCPSINSIPEAEAILTELEEAGIINRDHNRMYRLRKSHPTVSQIKTRPTQRETEHHATAKPAPKPADIVDTIPSFLKQPVHTSVLEQPAPEVRIQNGITRIDSDDLKTAIHQHILDVTKTANQPLDLDGPRPAIKIPSTTETRYGFGDGPNFKYRWELPEPGTKLPEWPTHLSHPAPEPDTTPAVIAETLRAIGTEPYTITIKSEGCTLEYKGNQT